jgi:hypothetical protein
MNIFVFVFNLTGLHTRAILILKYYWCNIHMNAACISSDLITADINGLFPQCCNKVHKLHRIQLYLTLTLFKLSVEKKILSIKTNDV